MASSFPDYPTFAKISFNISCFLLTIGQFLYPVCYFSYKSKSLYHFYPLLLTSQAVDASVNGVLGGYGHVNEPDVAASDEFLMDVFRTIAHPSLSDGTKNLVALGDCSTQC